MNRINPSGSSSCGLQRVRQPPMPPPLTIQADPAPVAQTFFVDEEIQALNLTLTLTLTLIFFADDKTQALYSLWRIYLLWTMRTGALHARRHHHGRRRQAHPRAPRR